MTKEEKDSQFSKSELLNKIQESISKKKVSDEEPQEEIEKTETLISKY